MRTAQITRETKETRIDLRLCLDGGPVEVHTGIGFFDHMLTALAFYGGLGWSSPPRAIWRWTATTRWRTWASCWARP